MKQHLLKDGSPGTPRRARAAERSPASASAREMGGERHAPSGPWHRRASCRDAQCSRSSAGSTQPVLSRRASHLSALACKKSLGRGRLQAATPVPTAAAPPEASESSLCLSLCDLLLIYVCLSL